ncbi:MAG: LytR C-terminal domain-containing protein [Candidatus Cloacimonadota bacterium]|nr:LytR C-terminal domain-containing protein [Candidatus Cloacimonadota bacterium]
MSIKLVITISIFSIITISVIGYFFNNRNENTEKVEEKNLLPIRVNVLNGCGFNGLARKISNSFDIDKIEVLNVGNTPKTIYNKCIIVVKTDNRKDLRRLQEYTSIKRFVFAINEYSEADFNIILGNDYQNYFK